MTSATTPNPASPGPASHSEDESDCTFCAISALHPPSPSLQIPEATPNSTSHVLLSTPTALAFLDIFPLSPCHILLIPRRHSPTVSGLTPTESSAVAAWLPLLARAAQTVSGYTDYNIVQNNGRNAAQVVPHVHYHIIPRPDERQRQELEVRTPSVHKNRWWKSPFGGGWRVELGDEEGREMADRLREELRRQVEREGERERGFLASL